MKDESPSLTESLIPRAEKHLRKLIEINNLVPVTIKVVDIDGFEMSIDLIVKIDKLDKVKSDYENMPRKDMLNLKMLTSLFVVYGWAMLYNPNIKKDSLQFIEGV